jgi:hypothetical protein
VIGLRTTFQYDDRGGLGLSQFGIDQDLGAQRLVQYVGATGEEQAQVIGQEGVVGSPIAGQVVCECPL